MTQELKSEFGVALVSWIFLLISKMAHFLPELQVFAVFLAIVSSLISIILGLPKVFVLIKKFFK